MEEQIKRKYEILLSEPEERTDSVAGKQVGAELEKNEFSIGHSLRRARLWKGLTLKQVAQGICKKSVLERLEKGWGENFSGFEHHLLLRSLLNRMGMFAGKYDFYYDEKERGKEALRKWLVAWRGSFGGGKDRNAWCTFPATGEKQGAAWTSQQKQTEFLKELRLPEGASYEEASGAFEAMNDVEWERIWVSWQKRIRALSQDELSEEARRTWEELLTQKLFYTQEEWEFLYALAEYYKRKKEYKKTEEIYGRMYQNAMGFGMDDERQLELLPEFCLIYGKFLWEHKENGKYGEHRAQDILMHGIQLNLKFRRIYFLSDLMETYCAKRYDMLSDASKEDLRKQRKSDRKPEDSITKFLEEIDLKDENEIKIVAELLQYGQYLAALWMAQKKYEKAKQQLIFMKEELGWQALALDYTCGVLEKH